MPSLAGRTIAILTHESDDFTSGGYLLAELCKVFQEQGARIEVRRGAVPSTALVDLAILHTDRTTVEPEYRAALASYSTVINGAALSIAKRTVSEQLVQPGEAVDGPVIVKTDANFGGLRETPPNPSAVVARDGRKYLRWEHVRRMPSYPVFASVRDVPPGVWSNPYLVVERFLPERTGAAPPEPQYAVREWVFFGGQSVHYRNLSHQPVIKSSNVERREMLSDEIPEELRVRRRELGLDYGKFDYVLVDGRAILLDANRTPGLPRRASELSDAELSDRLITRERLEAFARGIEDFLP